MSDDLPYRAEYAKSGRAGCKSCKSNIGKDVLRLAVMVQSPMFDGKVPHWYHFPCFFIKQRPKTVGDIAHYDSLRWEDQEKIKAKIDACGGAAGSSAGGTASPATNGKGKAKKRGATGGLQDFSVEYAKSGRAMCRGCEQKIAKDEVRISKKDFESDAAKRYGGADLWHHIECFAKLRDELQYWASGSELPGIKTLSKEDQQRVVESIPKVTPKVIKDEVDCPTPAKKVKTEENGENDVLQKQNKIMFKYRDQLKDQLKKKELQALLEYNHQEVPPGPEKMLDRLADIMTFGKLLPCPQCKDGQFVFRSGVGYQCLGNVSEWAKCENKTLDPVRAPFKVPSDLKETYSFLENYKFKPQKRVIKITAPSSLPSSVTSHLPNYPVKSEPGKSIPKVNRPPPPFDNMEFVMVGRLKGDKDELKKMIVRNGGKVSGRIHSKTFAIISSKGEVERLGSRMLQAQEEDVHVVSEDFVQAVLDGETALSAIDKKSISSWGGDPQKRILEQAESSKSRSGSMFKSKSGTVKLKLKDGSAVDPDSGLEDQAHVYKEDKVVYNAALCLTDVQKDKNSFYKLQILESDRKNRYWLFRSWGRIGTTIGDKKLEPLSLDEAMEKFEDLYREKSGNEWCSRNHFVKMPGRMYPMEVDYGEDKPKMLGQATGDVKSKLAKSVQDLISTIFDVESMKKRMLEFELDLQKMPLGKLSQRQLLQAYSILREALELVQREAVQSPLLRDKSPNSRSKYIELTNRFFTLVPHDFGVDTPPILNTEELIKQKMEILDNLLEIEIAYSLLGSGDSNDKVHPVDAQYDKLKADIEVLDKKSDEFELLQKYVKNTHAATHTQYGLEIAEVFKVRRQGEDRKFKPFEKLPNRKLLWHGSRVTNYAGILSQGLRIAPPEAPVTGYMFGKGVYFADMVSKSANYCMTSKTNPIGYMLLCEVALGNMYERTRADYIEKLPKGMHSCKGVGKTEPDPKAAVKTPDGVEIPLGEAITDIDKESTLLYNEYIVYDTAQVKFKYLFKMKFSYNM